MTSPLRATSRSTALLLTGALAVAACSWSVPANPGRNASLRDASSAWTATSASMPDAEAGTGAADVDPSANPGADPEVTQLYVSRCGRCHVPYPPTLVPAGRWPFFVAKYGPRAGLFGEERERVLAWLVANAR